MAEQFLRIGGTDGEKARALRTNENGHLIVDTTLESSDAYAYSGTISANDEKVSERKYEVTIHSLTLEFPNDSLSGLCYTFRFYEPKNDEFRRYLVSNGVGNQTNFITPTTAEFDGLFETVVNTSKKRVVRLRHPITVAGFRLGIENRGNTPLPYGATISFSERKK